jgi:hypothetical protein
MNLMHFVHFAREFKRAWRGARFGLRPFLAIYDSGNKFIFSLQLQFKSVAKNATTYTHAHTHRRHTL